jgi:hypothetical protein
MHLLLPLPQALVYFMCMLMPALIGCVGHLTLSAFSLIFQVLDVLSYCDSLVPKHLDCPCCVITGDGLSDPS